MALQYTTDEYINRPLWSSCLNRLDDGWGDVPFENWPMKLSEVDPTNRDPVGIHVYFTWQLVMAAIYERKRFMQVFRFRDANLSYAQFPFGDPPVWEDYLPDPIQEDLDFPLSNDIYRYTSGVGMMQMLKDALLDLLEFEVHNWTNSERFSYVLANLGDYDFTSDAFDDLRLTPSYFEELFEGPNVLNWINGKYITSTETINVLGVRWELHFRQAYEIINRCTHALDRTPDYAVARDNDTEIFFEDLEIDVNVDDEATAIGLYNGYKAASDADFSAYQDAIGPFYNNAPSGEYEDEPLRLCGKDAVSVGSEASGYTFRGGDRILNNEFVSWANISRSKDSVFTPPFNAFRQQDNLTLSYNKNSFYMDPYTSYLTGSPISFSFGSFSKYYVGRDSSFPPRIGDARSYSSSPADFPFDELPNSPAVGWVDQSNDIVQAEIKYFVQFDSRDERDFDNNFYFWDIMPPAITQSGGFKFS